MSTPLMTNRRMVLLKTETAQSSAVSPGATDATYVRDLVVTPTIAQEKRDFYRSTIGRLPSIPGESLYDVAFKMELHGSGTPGTAYTPLDAILQASGFVPTVHSGVEAIGAAVASSANLGVSPAPVITIGTPAFSSKSGKIRLTLTAKTITNPEDATFEAIFYPNDGTAAIVGTAQVTDSDFTANAFSGGLSSLALTTGDPDANGVGDPVSTWQIGDVWTFVYTSADQVDVQYVPSSAAISSSFFGPGKSMTMNAYFDGTKRIIAGIMGSLKTSIEVNKITVLEFKGMGIYAGPTDVAFPSASYNPTLPAICVSSAFTMQSLAAIISKLDLEFGNKLSKRVDTRAATGLLGFHITGREPVGSFDPEYQLVATHDFIARLKAGTEGAMSVKVGQTAGNICTITGPKAQYLDFKDAEREGKHIGEIGLAFNEDAGNDELVYTFT